MKDWHLDLKSFVLGFLTSGLFFFLVYRFRRAFQTFWQSILTHIETSVAFPSNVEVQFRKDVIRFSEREHLLHRLFPLSEILIPTRVISLTPPWNGEKEVSYEDITLEAVPLVYDDPLLASVYRRKSITLLEALAYGNARLMLMGDLGSGKTTALLETAMRLARSDHSFDTLKSYLPLYLTASNLLQELRKHSASIKSLSEAAKSSISVSLRRSYPQLLRKTIYSQRAVILLDGLDELPPNEVDKISDFLKKLLNEFPDIKIVLASSSIYISDFVSMGFSPLMLCFWDKSDIQLLLEKWSAALQKADLSSPDEATLWKSWASQEKESLNPIEWTLFLLLLFLKSPTPAHPSLLLEAGLTLTELDHSSLKTISEWAYQYITNTLQKSPPPPPPNVIEKLVSQGLLAQSSSQQHHFQNPLFLSYFASLALEDQEEENLKLISSKWSIAVKAATLAQARASLKTTPISALPTEELLRMASALRYTRIPSENRTQVIKQVANKILDEREPNYLRVKLFSAILHLPSEERLQITKFILTSNNPFLRQLGALGYGILPSVTDCKPLVKLLEDPHPGCFQSACLSLVNIGTSDAMDAVIAALLHGHDRLKEAAAQALANDTKVGHAILREAAKHDDPRVRKAVIPGLLRIEAAWAKELLQVMSINEELWLVKDAAANAFSQMELPNPMIPQKPPETANLPFLIQYASQKGYGLSPGKSNQEVLLNALESGDVETQLAVLDFYLFNPAKLATPIIEKLLESPDLELRSQAYRTLRSFTLCREVNN